jgi:NAD+ synthase (glutamine-hydrolysing)
MANLLKLHPELQAKLDAYRAQRAFNPEEWVKMKGTKLNDYMRKCGLKSCVVSVSGGVDSAVVLALCAFAKKLPDSPIQRVVGVCQPIHSSDWALARGKQNIAATGAEEVVVDQTDVHSTLSVRVEKAIGIEGKDFARGQLRSYMRTPVAYYVCQLVSQAGQPGIVMGTGNKDEDGYLAYFCKAGDGVVDVATIADLHKSEVFKIGRVLGVPDATLSAPPSAYLWAGQTDEEELGFTYDFIELYAGHFLTLSEEEKAKFQNALGEAATKQFDAWGKAAQEVHRRNAHKLAGIINV